MDYDNSGALDETELKAITRKFNPSGACLTIVAQSLLVFGATSFMRRMGWTDCARPPRSGKMLTKSSFQNATLRSYTQDMLELTIDMPSEEFDNLCQQVGRRSVVAARHTPHPSLRRILLTRIFQRPGAPQEQHSRNPQHVFRV